MKPSSKTLIISILIPVLVGFLSSLLTRSGVGESAFLVKPPLSPPGWLFPIVWTILYFLMGLASYYVISSDANPTQKKKALIFYGIQLFINFIWSFIFFNMQMYFAAFLLIILLWIFIVLTLISFYKISKTAGYLLIPYLLWVTFAAYLTYSIWVLN